MAYYDVAHKSMLGWYIYLIHDFVMPLPQHTRSSSINQLTKGLPGIQPAYPPCIPTLPKHSSEARACTRATGWAPPIWYSELLHSTEYQLVANPLDWDYILLLGCWAQSHSYKNTLISVLYYFDLVKRVKFGVSRHFGRALWIFLIMVTLWLKLVIFGVSEHYLENLWK